MGHLITLSAADGHSLSAYEAGLPEAPRALVVLQEIFGVNHHMRSVVDGFADAGFHVIAPALFDRAEPGAELAYDKAGIERGLELRGRIDEAATLADIEAAAAHLGRETVGVIGYCWGGTLAWLGAARTSRFKAACGWYGGGIAKAVDETPRCPVQLHFGLEDHSISPADIALITARHPEVEVFTYEGAGHGFGCHERGSYDAKSAAMAQERSLAFLTRHL
jgi:carboxymethylenebutenolidase